jgi:membrane protein DedA with SNARE-associated domain
LKSIFIGINIVGILIWVLLIGSGAYLMYKGKKIEDKEKREKGREILMAGYFFWIVYYSISIAVRLLGGL